MFNFKRPRTISMKDFLKRQYARERREQLEYEKKIAESQAKLKETKLVPGYTRIYC